MPVKLISLSDPMRLNSVMQNDNVGATRDIHILVIPAIHRRMSFEDKIELMLRFSMLHDNDVSIVSFYFSQSYNIRLHIYRDINNI